MKRTPFGLALIGLLLAVVPMWSHHSHGNYNVAKFTNLKGKVTEIHWINPHTWIYLEVTNDKGQRDVWALEGAGVTQLARKGWAKDAIKTGDTLSVRCHQLQDNTNGCLLGYVSIGGAPEKSFD